MRLGALRNLAWLEFDTQRPTVKAGAQEKPGNGTSSNIVPQETVSPENSVAWKLAPLDKSCMGTRENASDEQCSNGRQINGRV